MKLLVLASVSAVASGAAATAWNSNCADVACSRQGSVVGPTAPFTVAWEATLPASMMLPTGIILPVVGQSIQVPASASVAVGIAPSYNTFNKSNGANGVSETYPEFAYEATYSFGVPATRVSGSPDAAPGLSVVVLGMGYELDNGTYVSTLFAVDDASGAVVWNVTWPSSLIGDVVAASDGQHAYAVVGGGLYKLDAATGAMVWVATVPGLAYGGGTLGRLTLSPDGAVAVVTNGTGLAALDLTNAGALLWTAGEGLNLAAAAKPAVDGATASVLLPNGTGLLSFALATGALQWAATFPDVSAFSPALAVPANAPVAFVSASSSLASQQGAAILYAVDKASGAIAAQYLFNASAYSSWGTALVVDATGLTLFTALLGPLAPGSAAASHAASTEAGTSPLSFDDAFAATVSGGGRRLQAGGSVYVATISYSAATGAFGPAAVQLLPSVLQSGFPRFAIGPGPGALTLATGPGIAVLV